jgi:uncharacterized protein (DUF488 family)
MLGQTIVTQVSRRLLQRIFRVGRSLTCRKRFRLRVSRQVGNDFVENRKIKRVHTVLVEATFENHFAESFM